jgi:hypothetical protein
MRKNPNSKEPLFDPTQVKAQFERALPKVVIEIADLFEQSVPRLTRRDKKRILQEFSSGLGVVARHVAKLEEINGDPARLRESYENLEQIFREYLRRSNFKMRPDEDAYDCFVRQSERLIKVPYRLKRLKRFRLVQDGVQVLIRNAMSAPGGLKAADDLISEFGRKHLKEYLRFANTVDARLNSYSNIDLRKATARNVTRVADLYRDIAAALEHRLRLLVGLNFIAIAQPKPYADLRSFGYNQLLQAVELPRNPLLHFLEGLC